MKTIKPSELLIAKITFAPDATMAHGGAVFPEHKFILADKQKGFCGWAAHYVYANKFVALQAKWQTQSVPAGAVDEEMKHLGEQDAYIGLNKKELREVAKDIVTSRTPFATSMKHFCLVHLRGNDWAAIGINMGEPVFKALWEQLGARENITFPQHQQALHELAADNTASMVVQEQDTVTVFTPNAAATWVGKNTGIELSCGSTIRLSLDHIKGSCQDNEIVCQSAELESENNYTLGISHKQSVKLLDCAALAMPFDFSQKRQDLGEVEPSANVWEELFKHLALGVFALSNPIMRETTKE